MCVTDMRVSGLRNATACEPSERLLETESGSRGDGMDILVLRLRY